MATREQVRTMKTVQPFQPFLVKLADGRTFEVAYPELVACSKNGREMTIFDDDGMHLVEMLLVIELMPKSPSGTARRRPGKSRRREDQGAAENSRSLDMAAETAIEPPA